MKVLQRAVLVTAVIAFATGAALPGAWAGEPARKAPVPPSISVSNGVAGAPQVVNIVAGRLAGQSVSVQFAGPGGTSTQAVTLNQFGIGSMMWTPSAPGSWVVTGVGRLASAPSVNVAAAQLPTCVTLFAPVSAGVNTMTLLPVRVAVPGQVTSPTGSVSLVNANGTTITTATLIPGEGGVSNATLTWAPQSTGVWTMRAVYQPSNSMFLASNSNPVQVQVQPSASTVAITIPSSFYVGTQTTVGAVITPGTTSGSAAFLLNNSSLSGSVGTSINTSYGAPISTVSATWTPTFAGSQLLTAQFTSASGMLSQQQQQAINVLPAQIPDPISVTAPGQVPVGKAAAFAVSTTSGGPSIAWTNSPNCALRGATIVGLAAGPCTLAVTSLGGGSYSLNSTITVLTIG